MAHCAPRWQVKIFKKRREFKMNVFIVCIRSKNDAAVNPPSEVSVHWPFWSQHWISRSHDIHHQTIKVTPQLRASNDRLCWWNTVMNVNITDRANKICKCELCISSSKRLNNSKDYTSSSAMAYLYLPRSQHQRQLACDLSEMTTEIISRFRSWLEIRAHGWLCVGAYWSGKLAEARLLALSANQSHATRQPDVISDEAPETATCGMMFPHWRL